MDKNILKGIEKSIYRITKDIQKKSGIVGSDKITSLSRLINSYNRLKNSIALEKPEEKPMSFHECLEKNIPWKPEKN